MLSFRFQHSTFAQFADIESFLSILFPTHIVRHYSDGEYTHGFAIQTVMRCHIHALISHDAGDRNKMMAVARCFSRYHFVNSNKFILHLSWKFRPLCRFICVHIRTILSVWMQIASFKRFAFVGELNVISKGMTGSFFMMKWRWRCKQKKALERGLIANGVLRAAAAHNAYCFHKISLRKGFSFTHHLFGRF